MEVDKLGFLPVFENASLGQESALQLELLNREVPLVVNDRINPERALQVVARLKSFSVDQKFVFEGFDFEEYARIIAPDVAWLREQTQGKIDFSLLPPKPNTPSQSTEHSQKSNMILALNAEMLASERGAIRMQLFREMWRLSIGQTKGTTNLNRIIGLCRETGFLLNAAHNLRAMKLHRPAMLALARVARLSGGTDSQLLSLWP